jgi:hypothetical protein
MYTMTSPVDFSTGDIWRAASDESPLYSTEEAKRAIEGSGKDFGKSNLTIDILYTLDSASNYSAIQKLKP